MHFTRLLDKPCVLIKIIYDQAVQDQMLDNALEFFVSAVEQLDIEIPLAVDDRRVIGGVASSFWILLGSCSFHLNIQGSLKSMNGASFMPRITTPDTTAARQCRSSGRLMET